MPGREVLPSTVQRSDPRAQEIWAKTHDAAVDTYGEGERAHRTAFASLKHEYEKVGDHWESKGRRGPSDEQAARGYAAPRTQTAAGVDANATREHLLGVARKLDIPGSAKMDKPALVKAIQKANDRKTREARGRR